MSETKVITIVSGKLKLSAEADESVSGKEFDEEVENVYSEIEAQLELGLQAVARSLMEKFSIISSFQVEI